MKTHRAKKCDISQRVKKRVWERDGGRCVICGNPVNAMPNAHYISRARGGLGIEQNIVTLCTDFTENRCHSRYDNGSAEERARIGQKIREYLMSKYPDWEENELYYKRRF